MLIKFSREYKTQFPVQIELVNPPEGNWMMLQNEFDIVAEIYGYGFDLFSYKYFGVNKIVLDVSEFDVSSKGKGFYIIIPESYIGKQVNREMNLKKQVLNIYPGKIKVDLSQAITKRIPVKLNVVSLPAQGFKVKGTIKIEPDSIDFFGPASVLEKVEFIETEIDTIDDIRVLNVSKVDLKLDSLERYILDQPSAMLTVDVDELTSGFVEVTIARKVNKEGMEIRVLPSVAKVYYQVGLSDYQKVSERSIKASIVLPNTDELPEKLKVELSEVPEFIKVTRIEPLFVEYLIIK